MVLAKDIFGADEGGSRGRKRDRCNQKYCNERPCQNPGAGPKMMHDVTFCELKTDCRLVNAKRGSLVALAVKWLVGADANPGMLCPSGAYGPRTAPFRSVEEISSALVPHYPHRPIGSAGTKPPRCRAREGCAASGKVWPSVDQGRSPTPVSNRFMGSCCVNTPVGPTLPRSGDVQAAWWMEFSVGQSLESCGSRDCHR